MAHQPRKFDLKLDGISENQIAQHRDILYAGYVTKLNEIEEKLKTVDITKANQTFSDLRSLKIDESFALNGVILHELYFGNLGGKDSKPSGGLSEMIAGEWGSVDKWAAEFKACGMAARGWVILGLNTYDGRLHNYCLDSHNLFMPANTIAVLVMDVYEHAYTIDFGVKRPPYLDVFMKNIEWKACEARFSSIDMAKVRKAAAS